MCSLRVWASLFLTLTLSAIFSEAAAQNTSVRWGRGPGNPGTVCIYDYSANRTCDPVFSLNDTTGVVTFLGVFGGSVTVGCGNMPALTGDITSSAGSCSTAFANTVSVAKGGTGGTAFTANLPILGNGGSSQLIQGTVSGNTTKFATTSGTLTNNHCVSIDASGNFVDVGAACSAGGGIVNSGSINQLAYYASAGTTLSGLATANNGILATGGTGIPAIVATLPCANHPALTGDISNSAGSCAETLATVTVPKGGTGQTTFTANLPLIGNGTSAIAQGTRSGNTTVFATSTGTLTTNDCVKIDASGNFVDAGGTCTTGGAGGVVSSGLANQLAWYASSGTTVGGLTTANNGILATNGSGTPAIVASLPAANFPAITGDVTIPGGSTVATIPTLPVAKGGTGATSLTANVPVLGNGTSALTSGTRTGNTTNFCTASGTLTSGDVAVFDANGNIVDGGVPCTLAGDTSAASNPVAGNIGETISYSLNNVAVASATNVNGAFGQIPAGHWMCWAHVRANPAAATVTADAAVSVSTVSGTFNDVEGAEYPYQSKAGYPARINSGPTRYDSTSPATLYAVVYMEYSGGTLNINGKLACLRIW